MNTKAQSKKYKIASSNPKVIAFLEAYMSLCEEHHLTLSHEDWNGGFIVMGFDPENLEWVGDATEDLTTTLTE